MLSKRIYLLNTLMLSLYTNFNVIVASEINIIMWYLIFTDMTVAKPEISWVLDITIAYPQGKPLDLPTIVTGSRPPCETVLFYRLFPSSVVSDLIWNIL